MFVGTDQKEQPKNFGNVNLATTGGHMKSGIASPAMLLVPFFVLDSILTFYFNYNSTIRVFEVFYLFPIYS